MATPKDIPRERPSSQYASTSNSMASSGPSRHSSSRHHSHSVSLGAFNPDHRITRRKSVNTNTINNSNAIRAAINGLDESTAKPAHRRSLTSKGANRHTEMGPDASVGGQKGLEARGIDESAVTDDVDSTPQMGDASKARARRASEGSQLTGKRGSGELRCEKCGKGYKHSSCLTKHLWEHTPEWALTSKLLISKHQQVQLLEAASVLVGMNLDALPGDSDPAQPLESDNSSASPAASGSSGPPEEDEYSSAETTPPPMAEHYGVSEEMSSHRSKRYSTNSSSYSRSYQSAPSSSLPSNQGFAGMGVFSQHSRPSTSSGPVDDEEASLVAAVQSLCSFGTPRHGPVLLPPDVPPVPPLPAKFTEKGLHSDLEFRGMSGGTVTIHEVTDKDVEMEDHHAAEHLQSLQRGRANYDDADEGVFGGMEGLAHEAHETLSYARAS